MSGIVFVVDEDAHLVKLVSTVVVPMGFQLEAFTSGGEALRQVPVLRPALIVVGERNSDTDGLGLIAKLREKDRKLPVAYVAARWREAEFYRVLNEELHVSLVAHRPLKTSILKLQLSDLLNVASAYESDIDGGSMMPLPESRNDNGLGPGLEKWRRLFVSSIPARLDGLGRLLTAITLGEDSAQSVQEALIVAHNLKGTALSWGFTDLGETAGQMEQLLKSFSGNGHTAAVIEDSSALFRMLNEHALVLKGEDDVPVVVEESGDLSHDKAHILVVGAVDLPRNGTAQQSGIGVEMIHTNHVCALEDARDVALDAALIDIPAGEDTEQCLSLARQLRDLRGCENLPLAFIVSQKDHDRLERASRTHAGGSLVIERPLVDAEVVDGVIGKLLSLAEGGRFRVMVVDDDSDMSSLVCRCLGQFGIIASALNDPLQVGRFLNEFNPDLLLLDVMMPGMTGFDVCRKLRSTERWRDLPIIFLTSQTDLASRITAYEAGADDYLPKPVINVELLTRVKARLEKARELKERSERDLLTGLLMRRRFSEQSNVLISEAARHGFEFTVALLDVDHFKRVNDTYGHDAGDLVLATIGRLLRKRFRVEDLRGRWGGEEFILAFRHENIETMQRALNRVLEELRGIVFPSNDHSFSVSFSAGLASFPTDGKNLHELVKTADMRLYIAKNKGRSMVVIEG